jgi:hypothetical protein
MDVKWAITEDQLIGPAIAHLQLLGSLVKEEVIYIYRKINHLKIELRRNGCLKMGLY